MQLVVPTVPPSSLYSLPHYPLPPNKGVSVALLDPSGALVRGSLSAEQSSQILIGEFPRFAKPGKSSNYDGRIRVLVERVDNDARLPKPDLCVTMHLDLRIMQAPKVDTSLFVPNVSLPRVDSAVLGFLESSCSVLRSKSHFQEPSCPSTRRSHGNYLCDKARGISLHRPLVPVRLRVGRTEIEGANPDIQAPIR